MFRPVACLISDLLFSFTQHVAGNLKLPRVLLRTSVASSFLAYAAFPLLLKRVTSPYKVTVWFLLSFVSKFPFQSMYVYIPFLFFVEGVNSTSIFYLCTILLFLIFRKFITSKNN